MASQFDLIIRQGLIVDGNGGEPFVGDLAVKDGRIAAIGTVDGGAGEEIDAKGALVTPGFIDVHTHYDGQAIWSERFAPSSGHGVTTVVCGNCGVGFAPCREKDRDLLISSMEGVEDIPEIVMTSGLTWEWESFPEFLDAIDKRKHDIDIAAYIPHSALRVYVMGDRGANREPATEADIARMVELVDQAMQAGAVGFATSRMSFHRRIDGEFIASFGAPEPEIHAIAREVARHGGIFQIVPALIEVPELERAKEEFEFLRRLSKTCGIPVTFTTAQPDFAPRRLDEIMEWVAEANKEEGVELRPQVFPRPVGMVLGWDLSANPFMECATYKTLAGLPLDQRIVELRKPEVRDKIVHEAAGVHTLPLMAMARHFTGMYAMGTSPDYEPDPASSVTEQAKARGVTPEEIAYDMLLEQEGDAKLMVAMGNYSDGNLDSIRSYLTEGASVVALGDGGAHYGLVCDASYPTFMLTHWARDRDRDRLGLADVIKAMSKTPAGLAGFSDRGELAVGKKADVNVIDFDALELHSPEVKFDLPAGGRRLNQTASGYRATLVGGKVIQRDGKPTGELPGRLVRASR
jgi:N-acyl-D-aspartate/D-glutamate deacylase